MKTLLRRLVQKWRAFAGIWRTDGWRRALWVAGNSVKASLVYWGGRTAGRVGIRLPARHVAGLPMHGPRISVVVPVHDVPGPVLEECLASVTGQTYQNWEMCICDDVSQRPDTLAVLDEYHGSDTRIRIVRAERNLGIAGATNVAAEQATGILLAFLDHDDVLHPHALAEMAAALQADPRIDLLYTDEDKIEPDGGYSDPYFKPDWSPEHLDSVMYVLHCLTIRKRLFWELGGMRPEFDGAQDYDLALRAGARASLVRHIPKVLYHWRKIPGSAAAVVDAKPAALDAGRRALIAAAAARGSAAKVEPGLLPGTFRMRRAIVPGSTVTLVIPSRDPVAEVEGRGRIELLPNVVTSIIERSTYRDYRILVVDDGQVSPSTAQVLEAADVRRVSYRAPGRFNFAAKVNFAVRHVDTEYMVLLNDDVEVVAPGWLEALLEFAQVPEVAAVGGRLLFPDGRLQHAGLVCGVYGVAAHLFYGLSADAVGYQGFTHLVRNYSAVTAAVMATRRSVFDELGGFDERFACDYNDVDYCLRAGARGYRVVYTPYCELHHFEGSTFVRSSQDPVEVRLFRKRWGSVLKNDPYYNPGLPRDRADCVVQWP
jgi:O-antigen biosynthesis protein